MNIFYARAINSEIVIQLKKEKNYIALYWDKWDDHGFKTQFQMDIVINGETVAPDIEIKILIENSDFSGNFLDELLASGWDGVFPIPNQNYVSLPSDINFYRILHSKLGGDETIKILSTLRDASYIKKTLKNEATSASLIDSQGFNTSLLRESGAIKAFVDGWNIFGKVKVSLIEDFTLHIPGDDDDTLDINFKFNSDVLPYDINVLVGPNGVGKSYCLKSLVEYWLKTGLGSPESLAKIGHKPFDHHPNLERLILISYSPFEEFALDLEDSNLQDKKVYKYFGFRKGYKEEDGQTSIRISRTLPAADSFNSIFDALSEDKDLGFIEDRPKKLETIIQILKEAIDFDDLAFELNAGLESNLGFAQLNSFKLRPLVFSENGKYYQKISLEILERYDEQEWFGFSEQTSGVMFVKDNKIVELSSGQRLFSYIVINVVGAIRNNSLIIIDEPELFLHPNLEITLIGLLKDLLQRFASKAIIATHSLVAVREIPANCVHVFRKSENGRDVIRPPFETFGCDVQRISSYVFGDKSVSKPYESWITSKVKEFGTSQKFIDALGSELNEEMLIRIKYEGRLL